MTRPEYKKLLDDHPNLLKPTFRADQPKHGVVHHIDTGQSKPCKAKVRPLMAGSPKAVEGERQWRELERLGIIEPVDPSINNTWTSALHLAPKADGTLRVVGDFRPLNLKTILDGYPLPNLKTFVDKLRGCTIFSKIDLLKAFHQIPLSEESKAKTTTITPWGAWQYRRLPMGLRNSAQSFQRMMSHILSGLPNVFCYMDDLLIYSKSESDHLRTIKDLFKRLDDNGLHLSLKKCDFGKPELDFVGYRVNCNGIKPLPKKLEAIRAFPKPNKQKLLLGFLGALNYYRSSLPDLNGYPPHTSFNHCFQRQHANYLWV